MPLQAHRTGRGTGRAGFSLPELLITMAIFLVILFGIYLALESTDSTYARGAADVDLQTEGRRAVEEMAKMLRQAGADPLKKAFFGFRDATGFTPVAEANRVLFSLDADEDGTLDADAAERVGFLVVGGELRRTVNGTSALAGTPPVARFVQSLTFSYFTGSDTQLTAPVSAAGRATIRRVRIQLTLARSVPWQSDRTFTVTTDVRLRSL